MQRIILFSALLFMAVSCMVPGIHSVQRMMVRIYNSIFCLTKQVHLEAIVDGGGSKNYLFLMISHI